MAAVACYIAEVLECAAIRLHGSLQQGFCDARDNACREERELKTGLSDFRGAEQKNHNRRQADGVEQSNAPKKRAGQQVDRRHQCCAHDGRPVFDDCHIKAERRDRRESSRGSRQPQLFARPEKERCEYAYVQAGHNEHVELPGFAEGLGLLRIEKATIPEQHGSCNCGAVFRGRKHPVQVIQQTPAQPRQIMRQLWRRAGHDLHQRRIP